MTATEMTQVGIYLYWLPLGAGGHFVRFNGRVYEWIKAHREHRRPAALYHTALEVIVPEGRFVIENAWPIPDGHSATRGVSVEGPVWSRTLGRLRVFRYEVRRWRDGTIADVAEAVGGPRRVSHDPDKADTILDLVEQVPVHLWGRDELRLGEMWNSNSVVSWLLTKVGLLTAEMRPPGGGRAPGWTTGIAVARRELAGRGKAA